MDWNQGINVEKNLAPINVGIIGAGVIGLTSGIRILDSFPNARVTFYAHLFSPNTTSDVSAGLWEPYCIEGGDQQKKIL